MESVPQRGSVWPGFANQKLNSDCGSSQHATALWYRPHPVSPSPCHPVFLSTPPVSPLGSWFSYANSGRRKY